MNARDTAAQEVEYLKDAVQKLKTVQHKFMASKDALRVWRRPTPRKSLIKYFIIQVMKPENQGKEILLPLNDGVFVSGHLEAATTVMVDLGTGYYMEKARNIRDYSLNKWRRRLARRRRFSIGRLSI